MCTYKYVIVCTLCGYNHIFTLKVNLNKTLVRASQKGEPVWWVGIQSCCDWLPGTPQRSPIHLLDYRENKVNWRCYGALLAWKHSTGFTCFQLLDQEALLAARFLKGGLWANTRLIHVLPPSPLSGIRVGRAMANKRKWTKKKKKKKKVQQPERHKEQTERLIEKKKKKEEQQ